MGIFFLEVIRILFFFLSSKKRAPPLKEGMSGTKHSVDDVEVSTSEAGHHLS